LGFPESYKQRVETICKLVKDDAEGGSPDDPDALSSEQQRFTVLSEALNDLIGLIPTNRWIDQGNGITGRKSSGIPQPEIW
jgi:hypothetical protein